MTLLHTRFSTGWLGKNRTEIACPREVASGGFVYAARQLDNDYQNDRKVLPIPRFGAYLSQWAPTS